MSDELQRHRVREVRRIQQADLRKGVDSEDGHSQDPAHPPSDTRVRAPAQHDQRRAAEDSDHEDVEGRGAEGGELPDG